MMDAIINPEGRKPLCMCESHVGYFLIDLTAIIVLARLIIAVVISTRILNVSIILPSFPLVCIYYTPIPFICQYLYFNFCIKNEGGLLRPHSERIHK